MGRALCVVCVLGVLGMSSYAAAEPAARPWATGVSDTDQARALELLARGNVLFYQDAYMPALELYRQALEIWDHPAIHYNIAVADIDLARTIDAYQELESALKFPEALEDRGQALAYERLLYAQIVHLSIDCVDPGTKITLDGADLAVPCPGSLKQQLITPGRHHLIAAKPGYLTQTIELVPSGGETPHERIDLMTIEEATVTHRRWKQWKPWTVVGAGAAIGLAGLIFELQSAATFRSFDKAVATLCPDQPCTSLPGVVSGAYTEARRENHVAIGLFATAGATLVTGAVLVWLDRAVSERLGYEHLPIPTASVGHGESTLGLRIPF